MPEPTEGQPQGDPAGSPPTNPNPVPPTDPTPQDPPPAGDPQDVEGYRRALEAARAEAKEAKREASSHKRAHDELAAKAKAEEDAKNSAEERALARAEAAEKAIADMQARMRLQSVRHAVASDATRENFHDADDAYRFLDLDTVEFDGDEPKGIDDLVKDLAKAKPHLVKSAASPSGPPPTPKATGQNGQLTPDEQRDIDRRFALHTRSRF